MPDPLIDRKRLEEAGTFAEALVEAHGIQALPIRPEELLAEEPVSLLPGDFGASFDGRLEFDREIERFLLFYNTYGREPASGRTRFSLAHEAGHYFLDEHRHVLEEGGDAHYSRSGFIVEGQMEREADTFAAHLLMPEQLVAPRCQDPDLRRIIALAKEFQASLVCAAIRFVETTPATCALVVTEDEHVAYAVQSPPLHARGWLYIPKGMPMPGNAVSRRAMRALADCRQNCIVEGETSIHAWSERERGRDHAMWEQAIHQQSLKRTLTLLVYEPDPHETDEDDESEESE